MSNAKLKKLIPEGIIGGGIVSRNAFRRLKEDEQSQKETGQELYNLVTDPTNNLTKETKKKFLETVRKYNEYGKSIYREQSLKEISQNIAAIGKLAEKIAVNETDDWFDGITVKRDMKSLQDSVKMFEATCKEAAQMQHRLESLYESIGSGLAKYFDIENNNE